MQLPPVDGQKVFKANVWKLFHPLFLEEPQRQTDLRFFNILNKIRFGIVDDEVRAVLTERWQQFDPRQGLWNTTYFSSLREEADALNQVVLSSLPPENPVGLQEFNVIQLRNWRNCLVFLWRRLGPQTATRATAAKQQGYYSSELSKPIESN